MVTLLFQLKSLYTNIPHILSETRYFSFTPSSLEIACFPGGSVVKNPPAYAGNVKDTSSIRGLERCPGEGNGNPLQYSSWEIPWTEEPGRLVHGVAKRHDLVTKQQYIYTYMHACIYDLGVILSPRLENSVYTQCPNLNITTALPSFKTEPTLITRKIPPNIQPEVYWRADKYLPFNARIIHSLILEIFPSSVKYQII